MPIETGVGQGDAGTTIKPISTNDQAQQISLLSYNYKSVSARNVYEFMTDTFLGGGGYRDGSYLIPHGREVEMFYTMRRDAAFLRNFFAPIIKAMVDPITNTGINREIKINDTPTDILLANVFVDDVDYRCHDIQSFIHDALIYSMIHGVTFVVVDNDLDINTKMTVADAIKTRSMPYVYIKTANTVKAHKLDKYGALEEITFYDGEGKSVNGTGIVKHYTRWTREIAQKIELSGTKKIIVKTTEHGLGVVPVIPVVTGVLTNPESLLVEPPHYDIAKINHAVFNKDSEIRDQERAQAFSIFYMQSDGAPVAIGLHSVLSLPLTTSIAPNYASPDPNILSGLVSNCEKLIESLFTIASQRGVIGVKAVRSGVALEWEFTAQDAILKKTAQLAEWLEYEIIRMFQLYTGESFDYHVKYPDSFKPQSKAEDIGTNDSVLQMGMPPIAELLLKRAAFIAASKGQNEDMVKKALDEFDFQINNAAGVMDVSSDNNADNNMGDME
jgi:hypothetical protein